MPGVLIAQNTGLRARGGGKTLYFRQILRLADGSAFAALTGNDCFGDAAGEWHIAGTHTKTDWNRDDNGVNALDFQIVECDVDHNNLTINAAPITDIDATQPELEAEDGTQIVTNRLPPGKTNIPYFEIAYVDAPVAGLQQVFFCVGQFSHATSKGRDWKNWNQIKLKITAVNALGHTIGTLPTDAPFAHIAAPTLTTNLRLGVYVGASA
jgi:hypothetical protein